MKKISILLAGFVLAANLYSANLVVKAGINPFGKLKLKGEVKQQVMGYSQNVKIDSEENASLSFNLALEGYQKINDNIEVGGGIGFNTVDKDAEYSLIPIYLSGKYNISNIKNELNLEPYVIGKVGYELSTDDTADGAITFGLGAGVNYKSFVLETAYNISKYSMSVSQGAEGVSQSADADATYSRLSLDFGYKFNF